MPTQFNGAEIEPVEVPVWALFEIVRIARDEINHRAWRYLRLIGYDWYRQKTMSVELRERGTVQMMVIVATFEHQFRDTVATVEVPLKQFEAMVPEIKGEGSSA